jgi:predicted ThiF/HesA family dinucleotide-utilizing enzyme
VARFIYMNERIRDKRPRGPVIVVQTGKKLRTTNRAMLVHRGEVIGEVRFEEDGLKAAPLHHVRAFVELADDVDVRYPRARK